MTKEKEWVISAFNPYTAAANAGCDTLPLSSANFVGCVIGCLNVLVW